jgi:hypothetical protein
MRIAVAAAVLLAAGTGSLAQGVYPPPPPELEILMDELQAADTALEAHGMLAFYTISYYDPPDIAFETAKLPALLPDSGACRNQDLSGTGLWDSLIGFFKEEGLPARALERVRDADQTVAIVARGWDGLSGTGAECSIGVYKIFFGIGKYMTLHFDYRPSFGAAPARAWWSSD